MLTARAHRLTPVVHAIDDAGSLCGARPRAGRWVPNTRIPVNCPGCLVRMTLPRYAFCLAPASVAPNGQQMRHVRRIGPEGMSRSSGHGKLETLCGLAASHDVELVQKTPAPREPGDCGSCVRKLRQLRTGLAITE